jgi:hypothetical protein
LRVCASTNDTIYDTDMPSLQRWKTILRACGICILSLTVRFLKAFQNNSDTLLTVDNLKQITSMFPSHSHLHLSCWHFWLFSGFFDWGCDA